MDLQMDMITHEPRAYELVPIDDHHIPVQEGVGGEVQKSLGDTYDTFAGYQGTVNHFIETGMVKQPGIAGNMRRVHCRDNQQCCQQNRSRGN
jgi:hypothetical protein